MLSKPTVLNYLLADGFVNVELRRILRHESQLVDLDIVDPVLLVAHLLQY